MPAVLDPAREEAADGDRAILAINTGSSSVKAALFRLTGGEPLPLGAHESSASPAGGHEAALRTTFAWLREQRMPLHAVGHRIVHGGPHHFAPQRVTPELLAALDAVAPLLPDHLPQAIAAIRHVARESPRLAQVACFDTAFHKNLPEAAQMYALPRHFHAEGLRRFGFHGLSYEFITAELRRLDGPQAGGRVVVAHLGSGASMAAIRDGASIDTSMGFTPASGLVMATRAGDIDAELIVHLMQQRGMSGAALGTLINRESGLLGISGSSASMQELLDQRAGDADAARAVDLFCYRAKKYLGAYAAVLGGLDTLVFTGGIGTHAAAVREGICGDLGFLGIHIDPARNRSNEPVISRNGGAVRVRVIRTNEELVIARHLAALAP